MFSTSMILKSVLAAALVTVVAGGSAPAAAQAPTLGALAKREQERRKGVKAPATVLTSDQVPKGSPAPPPAAPAAGAPAAGAKAAEKPEDPAKDEASWKARMAQLREELRRSEMFAEALQTRINSLSNDFVGRDDPYQRARISEDRVKAVAELDRVKADMQLQKKKIADLEDEARKAGVPPGWLR